VIDEISIELQAKDPEVNRLRSWHVEAGPDLFGVWIAKVCFGRMAPLVVLCATISRRRPRPDHSCAQGCAGAGPLSGGSACPTA